MTNNDIWEKYSISWTLDVSSFYRTDPGWYKESTAFSSDDGRYKWKIRFYPNGKNEQFQNYVAFAIVFLTEEPLSFQSSIAVLDSNDHLIKASWNPSKFNKAYIDFRFLSCGTLYSRLYDGFIKIEINAFIKIGDFFGNCINESGFFSSSGEYNLYVNKSKDGSVSLKQLKVDCIDSGITQDTNPFTIDESNENLCSEAPNIETIFIDPPVDDIKVPIILSGSPGKRVPLSSGLTEKKVPLSSETKTAENNSRKVSRKYKIEAHKLSDHAEPPKDPTAAEMLQKKLERNSKGHFEIESLDKDTVNVLLEFIHAGEVKVSNPDAAVELINRIAKCHCG